MTSPIKSHKFNVLSNKVCKTPGCKNRIKLRIVESGVEHDYCYSCYTALERNRRLIGTQRK